MSDEACAYCGRSGRPGEWRNERDFLTDRMAPYFVCDDCKKRYFVATDEARKQLRKWEDR